MEYSLKPLLDGGHYTSLVALAIAEIEGVWDNKSQFKRAWLISL